MPISISAISIEGATAKRLQSSAINPSGKINHMDLGLKNNYIHAMDALLASMRARQRGNVVNIIGAGGKVASPIHLPGGAANSALMLATLGLASVYAKFGVRINAINPGATITDRIREALELEAKAKGTSAEQVLAQGQQRAPLGRYAEPKEIASVALFLASDHATYVTGAVVPMDGGANPII